MKVYIQHFFVCLLFFNSMIYMSLKIFPHFTVKCVFLHEELPRERTGSAETQIWALFQIHVLSGQRWYVCDAFGLSI